VRYGHPDYYPSIAENLRTLRYRIGGNLHRARAKRHITLPKLAALSGLSPETIDQIELGKGHADLHTLLRLCVALGMEFPALLA
jgi:transcriptional regulator with XRE-family HTH domain